MAKGNLRKTKPFENGRSYDADKRSADKQKTLQRKTAREDKLSSDSSDVEIIPRFSPPFQQVSEIKAEMEEISNLLCQLQMETDMLAKLLKARRVKARLEELDLSNLMWGKISDSYKEGSTVDRTWMSVTCGLRGKLREILSNFQSSRAMFIVDHKEDSKRSPTAEVPSDEMADKMVSGTLKVELFEANTELDMGDKVRDDAVMDILSDLHQVFLDMMVLVDAPCEDIDNIEDNVANAGYFVNKQPHYANQMKNKCKK